MKYHPLVDHFDKSFAWMSDVLPDEVEEILDYIAFGESLKKHFPNDVTFNLSKQGGVKLTDYIPNNNAMLVVSEKLKDLLAKTGEDFEFYSVNIRDKKGRLVEKPYYLAQLVGSLPCLDWKNSDYENNDLIEGQVLYFRRLVLDAEKIPKNKHIFRLGEKEELIIVSHDLGYEIYRTHNCRGMIFQVIEEYGKEFRG